MKVTPASANTDPVSLSSSNAGQPDAHEDSPGIVDRFLHSVEVVTDDIASLAKAAMMRLEKATQSGSGCPSLHLNGLNLVPPHMGFGGCGGGC